MPLLTSRGTACGERIVFHIFLFFFSRPGSRRGARWQQLPRARSALTGAKKTRAFRRPISHRRPGGWIVISAVISFDLTRRFFPPHNRTKCRPSAENFSPARNIQVGRICFRIGTGRWVSGGRLQAPKVFVIKLYPPLSTFITVHIFDPSCNDF